jgi:hypothetical protein
MQTECSADLFGFVPVEGRKVVAGFDGGTMTSEAGAMLLGATDKQIRLVERFAGCFTDYRAADLVEHTVSGLVRQHGPRQARRLGEVYTAPRSQTAPQTLAAQPLIPLHDQLGHATLRRAPGPEHFMNLC